MQFYPIYILLIAFAVFISYLLFNLIYSKNNIPAIIHHHPVSIVIPIRDEAHNLPHLLHSLAKQDYKGTFEIILVNDQSVDDYSTPILTFRNQFPDVQLRIIDSLFDKSIHLTSKQQALDIGIRHASYDWVAFTDGDMHLHENWLASLIQAIGEDISLVYGHTIIRKKKNSLFEMYQSFQLEFLFATAFSFHTAKLRGSCMGNNLLVSKKMYEQIGGQKGIGYSITEDLDLLKIAAQKGFKAAPVIPFYPTAETHPCKTFGQFFHQVLRWLKGGLKQPFNLLPVLFLLGCQNLILILALLQFLPLCILYVSLINVLLTFLFTSVAFRKIGSGESVFLFPIYYIFMMLQTIFMVIPVLTMSPVWKKRHI